MIQSYTMLRREMHRVHGFEEHSVLHREVDGPEDAPAPPPEVVAALPPAPVRQLRARRPDVELLQQEADRTRRRGARR